MSKNYYKSKPRLTRAGRLVRTTVLVVFLIGLGYAATLGPVHAARAKAKILDGSQPVEITESLTITPAAYWLDEPLVEPLVELPIVPDLNSWAVYFGAQNGTVLRSPDRRLTIEVDDLGQGSASDAESILRERAQRILGKNAEVPAIRTETMASGSTLWHLDADEVLLAVVDHDGELVGLRAQTSGGESIESYRPAIGQLVETIA